MHFLLKNMFMEECEHLIKEYYNLIDGSYGTMCSNCGVILTIGCSDENLLENKIDTEMAVSIYNDKNIYGRSN